MKKQVTEKYFREAVKKNKDYHIQKIQVNPLAHRSTEADFFIQTKDQDILVEAKQVSINTKGPKRFDIHRLSQETKLIFFEDRFPRNKSYLFLNFWAGKQEKSLAFMIHIDKWIIYRRSNTKKTLSIDDCINNFSEFLVPFDDNGGWKITF